MQTPAISKHPKNIFEEGELTEEVVLSKMEITIWHVLFYFASTDNNKTPPFDLNGFRYEQINDSADIETKVKPLIQNILNEMN